VKSHDLHLLKIFEHLPPTAVLPIAVAAAHEGVSEKTIRRNYTLIRVSDRRKGVLKGDLQRRGAAAT
jgi:hypothetical protein